MTPITAALVPRRRRLRLYHDEEWGRPTRGDRALFEKICLEGFQSGLNWLTILRKRENFRRAFAGFDAPRDVTRLLNDAGIVRHRGKIDSTINNARRSLEIAEQFGSLSTTCGASSRTRVGGRRS